MCISVNTAVPHLCVIAVNVKGGGRLIVSYQLTSGAVIHMWVNVPLSTVYNCTQSGRLEDIPEKLIAANYCLLPERKSDLKEVFSSSTWGWDNFLTKSKNCTVFVINSPEAERRQTQQTNLRKLPWHPNSTKYNVVFVDFDVDEQDCLSKS